MPRRRSPPWPCGGGTSRDLRGQPPHRLPLQPAGLDLASSAAPDAARRPHSRPAATPRSRSPRRRRVRARGIDYFGNPTTFLTIQQSHIELVLHALSSIEVADRPVPEPADTPAWEAVASRAARDRSPEALRGAGVHLRLALRADRLRAARLCRRARSRPGRPMLEAARDLTHRIYKRLHLRARRHHARHRRDARFRHAARRLPGFRPRRDRLPARARACRPAMSAATS